MASPTAIVGYLALFVGVGFLFIFANLLLGWLLRPSDPHAEKQEIYECGEPTIGSSFVQFDIRFYVVALLFIIFDVEVAFFFPWATVFGKATRLANTPDPLVVAQGAGGEMALSQGAAALLSELGVADPTLASTTTVGGEPAADPGQTLRSASQQLAMASFFDILVFFGVLLVGFAYVWKRGDLDWVRAVSRSKASGGQRAPPAEEVAEEPVLSA